MKKNILFLLVCILIIGAFNTNCLAMLSGGYNISENREDYGKQNSRLDSFVSNDFNDESLTFMNTSIQNFISKVKAKESPDILYYLEINEKLNQNICELNEKIIVLNQKVIEEKKQSREVEKKLQIKNNEIQKIKNELQDEKKESENLKKVLQEKNDYDQKLELFKQNIKNQTDEDIRLNIFKTKIQATVQEFKECFNIINVPEDKLAQMRKLEAEIKIQEELILKLTEINKSQEDKIFQLEKQLNEVIAYKEKDKQVDDLEQINKVKIKKYIGPQLKSSALVDFDYSGVQSYVGHQCDSVFNTEDSLLGEKSNDETNRRSKKGLFKCCK